MKNLNPECWVGKHGNCDGNAMCDWILCDEIHDCECECHGPAQELAPVVGCGCLGHRMPGVRHIAACCAEPHIDQGSAGIR